MATTNTTPAANITVNPIPEYAGAIPYLYVSHASDALEFYIKAFGAVELICIRDLNNKISHCELEIGKARIMLSDEYLEANCLSPKRLGGASAAFTLYFKDAEKVFTQALAAGAHELRKVHKHFTGDLEGKLVDPFGHHWFIATHIEDVSYDDMIEIAAKEMKLH
jgi:PhnB protein